MQNPKIRQLPLNIAYSVIKSKRIESIDVLRGLVMIIMAIDHTRDYFHNDAFRYSPTDLSQTSVVLFFTRWITHFCAPVFVFLAGISAYLYGSRRSRKELAFFLFTRGVWLVLAELFIVSLEQTFNPHYHYFNLQVIWATGLSMIALSAIIYLDLRLILMLGVLLIAAHNLLDTVHVPGKGLPSFLWSLLHEPGYYTFGDFSFNVRYPVLPWIGIMATGYCFGSLFVPSYDPEKRRITLLSVGFGAVALFILLRLGNLYGDAANRASQKNGVYTFLSFLNVTKYPPSLLYVLMTLGPALIFLALAERPLNRVTSAISVFGRVPMFYYLAHFFLIHFLAVDGAVILGYKWWDMVLSTGVNLSPQLKGYGFSLLTVYIIWAVIIVVLYPFCKWYDRYKREHLATQKWLSYL